LAGKFLVALQLSHTSHSIHSCFKETTVWSKEGGIYIVAHHLQLPRGRDPTQRLGLHLMKVTSLQHWQNPHQGERRHRSETGTFQLACNRGQHYDRQPADQIHFLLIQ
jgi:hypothetical protein